MKNKKGLLLPEETLKMVLAVISILFLIGFLVAMYFSYVRNKDLELAETSLEYLIESIQSGATEVEIWNPKGWGLSSFNENSDRIPKFCLDNNWESCICICGEIGGSAKTPKVACLTIDEKGIICEESDFFIEEAIQFPPLILTINQESKIIVKKGTEVDAEGFGGAGTSRDF